MARRFKDFGSPKPKDPVEFDLHGEHFVCIPEVQGVVIMEFASASSGENGDAEAAALVENFLQEALEPESFERFQKLRRDKKKIVSIPKTTEIVGWLVEQYTERSEEPRED